jgi:hypothetical protein
MEEYRVMRFATRSFVIFLLVVLCTPAFSFDGVLPAHKLFDFQIETFTLLREYWNVQEAYNDYVMNENHQTESEWLEAIDAHAKRSSEMGRDVLSSIKKNKYGKLELLSEIYKSLPVEARPAYYMVLGFMKVEIIHSYKQHLSEEQFKAYFPGYGYTEPGYKYRKGREVAREEKGVTWQEEEVSISTNWNVSLTVSLDVLNILKGMLSSGVIKNLKVSKEFTMEVGGQPMICFNVSFQRTKSIKTKTTRRFEVNKIWFELLKAKSSMWSDSEWEVCGKTYEIVHEPTGESVVTSLQ